MATHTTLNFAQIDQLEMGLAVIDLVAKRALIDRPVIGTVIGDAVVKGNRDRYGSARRRLTKSRPPKRTRDSGQCIERGELERSHGHIFSGAMVGNGVE